MPPPRARDQTMNNLRAVEFFAPGRAAPGGSKTFMKHAVTGQMICLDAGKGNRSWKRTVAKAAKLAHRGEPFEGPLKLSVVFTMARPKSHYGTGRNAKTVKAKAPSFPIVAPDTTKLLRSTEDALKGICWLDDAQVVIQTAMKVYGSDPGARVIVEQIHPETTVLRRIV